MHTRSKTNKQALNRIKQQGFTILEMAMVIAVIGIVIGIMALSMRGNTNQATASALYATPNSLVNKWATINALSGTSPQISTTGGGTALLAGTAEVSSGINGDTTATDHRGEVLALLVEGIPHADGDRVVLASNEATIMIPATATARVRSFINSGARPMMDAFKKESDGSYSVEGYKIVNVSTPSTGIMRVVYEGVPNEMCELIRDRHTSRVRSGTGPGSQDGVLAGDQADCSAADGGTTVTSIDFYL